MLEIGTVTDILSFIFLMILVSKPAYQRLSTYLIGGMFVTAVIVKHLTPLTGTGEILKWVSVVCWIVHWLWPRKGMQALKDKKLTKKEQVQANGVFILLSSVGNVVKEIRVFSSEESAMNALEGIKQSVGESFKTKTNAGLLEVFYEDTLNSSEVLLESHQVINKAVSC